MCFFKLEQREIVTLNKEDFEYLPDGKTYYEHFMGFDDNELLTIYLSNKMVIQ